MKISRIIPLTFAIMALMAVSVFAADTSSIVVTSEMLTPIMEGISGTITAVLPFGVGILGTMLGIRLVPRIFHMFF